MSLVAISGNVSGTGTLTIAAPNTNSNRTLTLPDGTGTFNISGVVNEVPAGTVSAPSIYPTGDTNTGIFFPAADTIAFTEGGAEAMRIDSAGEVLIGATAATQTADGLFVKGKRTATSNQWNFQVYTNAGQSTLSCRDDYYLRSVAIYDRTNGSSANVFIDSSGYLYRSTSSIKYKRDVIDYDKGIATVTQLRPVYYKSKVNDPDGNPVNTQYAGLIAEELDALGLDEFVVKDNTGEVESIHYGNMVALLTKAIQEQQALIAQLQADVAALKGE